MTIFTPPLISSLLTIVALYQITVVYGSRHFDRCLVSPKMFVWLHLINSVMVDWTGGSVTRQYLLKNKMFVNWPAKFFINSSKPCMPYLGKMVCYKVHSVGCVQHNRYHHTVVQDLYRILTLSEIHHSISIEHAPQELQFDQPPSTVPTNSKRRLIVKQMKLYI